jgi:hypothetical protein
MIVITRRTALDVPDFSSTFIFALAHELLDFGHEKSVVGRCSESTTPHRR